MLINHVEWVLSKCMLRKQLNNTLDHTLQKDSSKMHFTTNLVIITKVFWSKVHQRYIATSYGPYYVVHTRVRNHDKNLAFIEENYYFTSKNAPKIFDSAEKSCTTKSCATKILSWKSCESCTIFVVISNPGSDPNHFFAINIGKRRIRHKTTLKLNTKFQIDSNSEYYVGSASFRHWFQK